MARKVSFSLAIEYDLLMSIKDNHNNIAKYINECIEMRQAELKLEKINVIQKYLQKNPNKIPDIITYINSLKTMLEDL